MQSLRGRAKMHRRSGGRKLKCLIYETVHTYRSVVRVGNWQGEAITVSLQLSLWGLCEAEWPGQRRNQRKWGQETQSQ